MHDLSFYFPVEYMHNMGVLDSGNWYFLFSLSSSTDCRLLASLMRTALAFALGALVISLIFLFLPSLGQWLLDNGH